MDFILYVGDVINDVGDVINGIRPTSLQCSDAGRQFPREVNVGVAGEDAWKYETSLIPVYGNTGIFTFPGDQWFCGVISLIRFGA